MLRIRMASDPKLDQLLQEVRHGPHGQVWTVHGDFVSADLGIQKKVQGFSHGISHGYLMFMLKYRMIYHADIKYHCFPWNFDYFPILCLCFLMISHTIFQWNNMITEMPAKKTHTHTMSVRYMKWSLTIWFVNQLWTLVTRGSSWIWPNQMAPVYRNHGRKKCLV